MLSIGRLDMWHFLRWKNAKHTEWCQQKQLERERERVQVCLNTSWEQKTAKRRAKLDELFNWVVSRATEAAKSNTPAMVSHLTLLSLLATGVGWTSCWLTTCKILLSQWPFWPQCLLATKSAKQSGAQTKWAHPKTAVATAAAQTNKVISFSDEITAS